ncbi:MAG: hypothetical protein JST86_17280 [Bacteroidetes bacterium]|nr:hypothetical protein [Bacteroidota bacterium]
MIYHFKMLSGVVVLCFSLHAKAQDYPSCLDTEAKKVAAMHQQNSCEGSDKLLRIDQYRYHDTLLYQLVFERSRPCPDYVSSTVYYDAGCAVKIRITDGGIKYRRQVVPMYVDTRQIQFIKTNQPKQITTVNPYPGSGSLNNLSARGQALQQFYLGMNVEQGWIAGSHVDWETGVADHPDATAGNHTHCSAFVAAACKKTGIYILRPPQHGQLLLANAQYDWLQTSEAAKSGWKEITNNNRNALYEQVQQLANAGNVIVAVCKNPDATKPGHAALVMPKIITADKISDAGPIVIMAGKHNFNYISLKNGFKSHLDNWPENVIRFFVNQNAPSL